MPSFASNGGFVSRLSGTLQIEPEERRPTLLLALFLMLGMATVICLKAVSDSLFLSEFDAKRLPYVDLAITGLVGIAVNFYLSWMRRAPLSSIVLTTQLFLVGNLAVFWLLLYADFRFLGVLIYVWVGVFAVLIPSQAWSLAGTVFTTRQAKRLFSIIGSGGILGAAIGGSFTGMIGDPDEVLPATVLLVAAAAWVARELSRSSAAAKTPGAAAEKAGTRAPLLESLSLVRRNRFLLLITIAIFLSTITSTLVKFEFKAIAQLHFEGDRDALTSFSGFFYGWVSVFSFLFHTIFSARLLRWFGLGWCLFLLPLSLAGGLGALLASSSIVAAVAARGADQGFRHSIDRASIELLYVPVPADLRARVKSFLDMVVGRAADGLASLLLLAVLTLMGLGLREVSVLSLAFIAVWLTVLWRLRRSYVVTLRETIERRGIEAETLLESLAESGPSAEVESSLLSTDQRDVEAAIGWIQLSGPGAARVQLASLLTHSSPEIRRKALAAIVAKDVPNCERQALAFLELENDVEQRWKALEYLRGRADRRIRAEIVSLLDSPDPELAAVSAAWLLREAPDEQAGRAREALGDYLTSAARGSPQARAAAARLMGLAPPDPERQGRLAEFLADDDPATVRAALASAAALQPWDMVERLIALLEDSSYASEARRALAAFGPSILERLSEPLRNASASARSQQQVARVLGMIGGREAARFLLAYLRRPQQAARLDALRALSRMRSRHEPQEFDRNVVNLLVEAALKRYYEAAYELAALDGGGGAASLFLGRAMGERRDRALDEAFALLSLVYPQKEIRDAHFRIHSGRSDLYSNAVEFLDSRLLGSPLRPLLLPILEQSSRGGVLEAGRQLFHLAPLPYSNVMRRLLTEPDPWLQACACGVAAERELHALEGPISALTSHPEPVVRESAEAARRRLQGDAPSSAWKS